MRPSMTRKVMLWRSWRYLRSGVLVTIWGLETTPDANLRYQKFLEREMAQMAPRMPLPFCPRSFDRALSGIIYGSRYGRPGFEP